MKKLAGFFPGVRSHRFDSGDGLSTDPGRAGLCRVLAVRHSQHLRVHHHGGVPASGVGAERQPASERVSGLLHGVGPPHHAERFVHHPEDGHVGQLHLQRHGLHGWRRSRLGRAVAQR